MPDRIYTKLFQYRFFLIICLMSMIVITGKSQSEIEIIHADLFGFEQDGEKFQQLTNNVIVKQDNVTLYCDSALKNDSRNTMDAYGHVKLTQGDSLTVTGNYLHYDGNTRIAKISNNVVLTQTDFTLNTMELVYDTKTKIGYYPVYGKLVNKENTLTSNSGYYYANQKYSYFKKNVDLKNKDYHITCDTLKYDNQTSVAYFTGFTTITKPADTTIITCYNGWYNKQKGNSQFSKKVVITQPRQVLYCDSINWNNEGERGDAWGNILVYDSVNKFQVTGQYGDYDRKKQITKVSNKALASQLVENDTMHLHGDTIFYYADSLNGKRMVAYHHVKIFKTNMQAVADSLYYSFNDSAMSFYTKPILWVDSTQLTADTISLRFKNQKPDLLILRRNSFIASKEDSVRFNQIKGKNIDGYFSDSKLQLVKVLQDGECVYYIKDEKKEYLGVNKITCADMDIHFDSGEVKSVNYKGTPEGIMYPVNELPVKDLLLKKFFWHEALRPKKKDDLLL